MFFTRLASVLRTSAIIFVIMLACVAVAEVVARFKVKDLKRDQPVFSLSYTDDVLKALYGSDNPTFYRDVLAEGWGNGIGRRYEPFVEFTNVPSHGRHVNVTEAGERTVPGREASLTAPGLKVLVFGGSTTFGMGVSDTETIPTYLQKALDSAGVHATVHNMGVVAYYSTQERVLFERLLNQGIHPDVVVFIDGLNDFYFCETPDRTEVSNLLTSIAKDRARISLVAELVERSNVLKLVRYYLQKTPVWAVAGAICRNSPEAVDRVIRRLDSNRRMIAAIARQFGIVPVFVQQPVPTYAYDNTRRAVALPEQKMLLDQHRNSALGYARMRELRDKGQLWSDNVLWMEELSIPENMYVDTIHYSPAFHRAIAKGIAQWLLKSNDHARRTP